MQISSKLTRGLVIFLSRSAADPGKYDNIVLELKALGCSAIMVSGSVIEEKDVERAIKMATKPVRGVIQASMVLKVRHSPLVHLTTRGVVADELKPY